MSPNPVDPSPGGGFGISGVPVTWPGVSIRGAIIRLMKFQSPTVIGITGWMFKKEASPLGAPKSKVNFNGRLYMAPTGFWTAALRSPPPFSSAQDTGVNINTVKQMIRMGLIRIIYLHGLICYF